MNILARKMVMLHTWSVSVSKYIQERILLDVHIIIQIRYRIVEEKNYNTPSAFKPLSP